MNKLVNFVRNTRFGRNFVEKYASVVNPSADPALVKSFVKLDAAVTGGVAFVAGVVVTALVVALF